MLSAAVTLVPVVVTVTLLAFAFTVPTLPAPVIFTPSALTLMEPTDASLFTVMAEPCATVMLSTEPETAMSVLAIMPLPALVSLKVTPLSPPRSTMRPVTVTPVRSILLTPSAMMRSPLMVLPDRETLFSRTITLPSTVADRESSASA